MPTSGAAGSCMATREEAATSGSRSPPGQSRGRIGLVELVEKLAEVGPAQEVAEPATNAQMVWTRTLW